MSLNIPAIVTLEGLCSPLAARASHFSYRSPLAAWQFLRPQPPGASLLALCIVRGQHVEPLCHLLAALLPTPGSDLSIARRHRLSSVRLLIFLAQRPCQSSLYRSNFNGWCPNAIQSGCLSYRPLATPSGGVDVGNGPKPASLVHDVCRASFYITIPRMALWKRVHMLRQHALRWHVTQVVYTCSNRRDMTWRDVTWRDVTWRAVTQCTYYLTLYDMISYHSSIWCNKTRNYLM